MGAEGWGQAAVSETTPQHLRLLALHAGKLRQRAAPQPHQPGTVQPHTAGPTMANEP